MDLMQFHIVYQGAFSTNHASAAVRRTQDYANGLSRAGARVQVLCPSHFQNYQTKEEHTEYEIVKLGLAQPSPTLWSRNRFWKCVVDHSLQKKTPCVLFYNTTLDSIFAIRHLSGKGIVVAYELSDLHSKSQHSALRRLMYRLGEKLLPRSSDLCIAISRGIEQYVVTSSPEKSVLKVPGLVDLKNFRAVENARANFIKLHGIPKDTVLLAFTGGWYLQKGLCDVLHAMAILKKQIDVPFKLIVTGKPTDDESVGNPMNLARQLDIESSVVLTGFIDDAELITMLSAADVAVSASERTAFSDYAFPTKICEFAALGKAIAATQVGDLSDYFEDCKNIRFCQPSNPESMAIVLSELIQDSKLRSRLGDNARKLAIEKFDSVVAGRDLIRTVNSLSLAVSR